jgi:hypothetical protein
MMPKNSQEIVRALIEKTRNKEAFWGKTSRPNEFKLTFEKGAVTIDNWEDNNENECYELGMYNSFGYKIASYSSEAQDQYHNLLRELHEEAKQEFYKVDDTISSFFEEIKDKKCIGFRCDEADTEAPF